MSELEKNIEWALTRITYIRDFLDKIKLSGEGTLLHGLFSTINDLELILLKIKDLTKG